MIKNRFLIVLALLLASSIGRTQPVSATAEALAGWKTPLIPRKILFAGMKHAFPLVSPNGLKLAYLAPHQGRLNIWVRTLGSSDDHPITEYQDHGVRYIFWQFDNRALLFYKDEGGNEDYKLFQARLQGGPRNITPPKAVGIYNVRLDPDSPDQAMMQLRSKDSNYYLYKLNLNSLALTPVERMSGSVWPDNNFQLAITADGYYGMQFKARDQDGKGWKNLFKLGVADIFEDIFGFSADNQKVFFGASLDSDTSQLIQMDLKTGAKRVLASDPRYDVEGALFNPSTHALEAVSFYKSRKHWQFFDPRVKNDFALLAKAHAGDIQVLSRDNSARFWTVAYVQAEAPETYYLYDREQAFAGPLFSERSELESYRLASTYDASFKARDGMQLYGYLSLPPGLPPKKLPIILLVHGGPWHRDQWGFDPELQWLCNRGYAVLQVNFRGSTGYGKAYLNAGNKEWGAKMSTDLLDAKKWAVDKGYADPGRVGIFGASYGGYAALAGLAFSPKEFRCGVDICGPSSLQTLFETLIKYHDYIGSTIIDYRVGRVDWQQNLLRRRSPLHSVGDIEAPVFIAQGQNDPRVPARESEQMVEALKRRGKEVKYVIFPDEGHGFEKWENQMALNEQIEEFLAAHLGGRMERPDFKSTEKADFVGHYSTNLAINEAGIASGKTSAMIVMGDRHMAGNGVVKSVELAKKWYAKAGDLGDMTGKHRLLFVDRLASEWFDKKHTLHPLFSDFSNKEGKSNWGMPWAGVFGGGICGTKIFFPASGTQVLDTLISSDGAAENVGHFSGHLGSNPEQCKEYPWATMFCDFLPGAMPLDFAAAGLPRKGIYFKMRTGPKHPDGKQNYGIGLHKFSVTPNNFNNNGHAFYFAIPGDKLSKTQWTEFRVDFPAQGAISIQPSKTFAQPDWVPKEARSPWDMSDLTKIDMGPAKQGQDFDFYVKDMKFF